MASVMDRNPRKVKEMLASLIYSPEVAANDESDPSGIGSPSSSKKITFNPGNRGMFLERVKTFSSAKWAVKPVSLSPLHCSRFGWVNNDNDTLICVTCKASIDAALPDDWDHETYETMCKDIEAKLKTGHDNLCPWQETPSPASFLDLPNQSKEEWTTFLKTSFEALVTLGKDMPLLDEDGLDKMGIAERGVIQELLRIVNHQATNDEQNLFARTAVALALCGWKPSEVIDNDAAIICDTCTKECGLWNYINVTEDATAVRVAKRLIPDKDGANLDARSIYASFMSDVSTFRSSEFVSSNVSMHSETDSQMSENGAQVFIQGFTSNEKGTRPGSIAASEGSEEKRPGTSNMEEKDEQSSDESAKPKSDKRVQRRSSFDGKTPVHIFTEPTAPNIGKMELMKALLFAKDGANYPAYSESMVSEVGSEAFENRIEIAKEELSAEEGTQDPDPPPPPPPYQETLMKELLLVTAPHEGSPKGSESIFSEVGSLMFDKRLETWSVCSPRAETPTLKDRIFNQEESYASRSSTLEGRVKRMRFHEPVLQTFNAVEEHRHWCPWILDTTIKSSDGTRETLQGWKRVLKSLLDKEKLLQGSPDEVWKSVRRVLNDCQSPQLDKTTKRQGDKSQ